MQKIDFFGGLHGNFLELMINMFVFRIDFDQDNLFNQNGSCHTKNDNEQYHPIITCRHYSFYNHKFNPDDQVIEIHCVENDLLIALTNSLIRGGDEVVDIHNLEYSTIEKLSKLKKIKPFVNHLIEQHGKQLNYPRSLLRKYFYSKFDSPELGIDFFNTFKHKGPKHQFPFSAFFNIENFYLELNKCAFFLNQDFYPTNRTHEIWQEFIDCNQGYASHLKCQRVFAAILSGDDMIIDLNIVEEAWILYRISRIFRCYDHPLLCGDKFISNTREIHNILYDWKKGH